MNILPSAVIAYVERAFPTVNAMKGSDHIGWTEAGFVRGLEALLSQIEPILFPSGEDGTLLIACRATLMSHVRQWEQMGGVAPLTHLRGHKDEHIIRMVHRILRKCPDEALPSELKGFEFIENVVLRSEFHRDYASIDFLVRNHQWKAATVLSGALMEALLFHKLSSFSEKERQEAAEKCKVTEKDMTRWHLPAYIKVAAALNIIGEKTRQQCELSGDLRNLIHPGKAIRDEMKCSMATTQTVVAGLNHIVEDLAK